jgi:hypothetical protein
VCLCYSLAGLVGTVRYLVLPQHRHFITDVQVFIRGLLGLDLIQSNLVTASECAQDFTGFSGVESGGGGDEITGQMC